MRHFTIIFVLLLSSGLYGCGGDGGNAAWTNGLSSAASTSPTSTGSGITVNLTYAAYTSPTPEQIITASVNGGTAPYEFIYNYSAQGSSNCINGTAYPSSQESYICAFSFAAPGTVSVIVTDSTGKTASSNVLAVPAL